MALNLWLDRNKRRKYAALIKEAFGKSIDKLVDDGCTIDGVDGHIICKQPSGKQYKLVWLPIDE